MRNNSSFFRCLIRCCCIFSVCIVYCSSDPGRALVFTSNAVIKLIVGLSMPIELPVSLNWFQNIQYQYNPIANATELTYLNLIKRRSFGSSFSRSDMYNILSDTWNIFGMNGTACVLRTICEIAETPLSHNGILGKILDSIFTPRKNSETMYNEARRIGRKMNKCDLFYSTCNRSILEHFTRLV